MEFGATEGEGRGAKWFPRQIWEMATSLAQVGEKEALGDVETQLVCCVHVED